MPHESDKSKTYGQLRGNANPVAVSEDGNVPVEIQDQTTPPFQFYLMREDKIDIGVTSIVSKGSKIINVTPGHGFTVVATPADYLVIWENGGFEQLKVIGVTSDAITVQIPFANEFSTESVVLRGKIDLDLDGSTTPVVARFKQYGVNAVTPIDIIGSRIEMLHGSSADRSKYGDLTALAGSNQVRFKQANGTNINLGVYQSNQDFAEFGWDIKFDDKAGGGDFSTEIELDIIKRFGVALRIDPRTNDFVDFINEGNIAALNRHRVIAFGQYTSGE